MKTKRKFRYIKKEEETEISVGNDWERWKIRIGFEVGNPNNERNSIKFDEEIIVKIGKLLEKARNNALFNEFERNKEIKNDKGK